MKIHFLLTIAFLLIRNTVLGVGVFSFLSSKSSTSPTSSPSSSSPTSSPSLTSSPSQTSSTSSTQPTLQRLPTITEQLTFKHFLPLLSAFNDTLKTKKELHIVAEKCYEFSSNYQELNDLTLALGNLIYSKNKEELFATITESQKKSPDIARILMKLMSEDQKCIITNFLQLIMALDESKVKDIVVSLITNSKEFLSNEENFPNLEDPNFKVACRFCSKLLDVIESNQEFFQIYFDGLITFRECIPYTGSMYITGVIDMFRVTVNDKPDAKTKKIKDDLQKLKFIIPETFNN